MRGGRIRHGGDLAEARRLFPDAPEPWIDLSTGINPVSYPLPPLDPALFRRLPSPGAAAELEALAARAYGADDPGGVVAAPGTQILIELLPRLLPPARVAVLGPTYAEHAPAWRRAGHAVRELAALDEAEDNTEILVLVNPNNPDGRVVPRAELVWFAEKGVRLFVDEAFADLEPVESLVPVLPPRSVILRSFGKTYGLAGVRLGFAVAEPPFAQMVREALGPWAVSGPTLAVGGAALADEAWRTGAAVERRADARRLDALLVGAGCAVVGGTSLFRLVGHERAEALFMHLGRAGLFVRAFAEAPTRLRLGLPGDAQAWDRLAGALASFRP